MEKPAIIVEKIHLRQITPNTEFFNNQFSLKNKEIRLAVAQSIKHSLANRSFKISLTILLDCEDQKIAEYLYDFIFEVANITDLLIEKNDKILFSGDLMGVLLSMAYSTLRGILYNKLADTQLKDFILPVISPNNLLKSRIMTRH